MTNNMTTDKLARITAEQFAKVDERFTKVDETLQELKTGQERILTAILDLPSKSVIQKLTHRIEQTDERVEEMDDRLTTIEQKLSAPASTPR